jgi:hypothetical protein
MAMEKMAKILCASAALMAALTTTALASTAFSPICMGFNNHTDRMVTVEFYSSNPDARFSTWAGVGDPYLTWKFESPPGLARSDMGACSGPVITIGPLCVRAHYRNPPMDAVKVAFHGEGRSEGCFNTKNFGISLTGIVDIEP